MGRRYETSNSYYCILTVEGITAEVRVSTVGWYSEGDAWGYGCEPPDGDEEITDVEFEEIYDETSEEGCEVELTEELKEKFLKELKTGKYFNA